MAVEERPTERGLEPRLEERILNTLTELPGRIAFSGLRRVLGVHPESLSRALRRLEREGLIDRENGGYRALSAPSSPGDLPTLELRLLARVGLPAAASPDGLLARLTGRWFGSLRWVGVVERPGQRLLTWARRDGTGYVLLGIQRGQLRVFVPEDPRTQDAAELEESAYELLVHAVDLLRIPSEGRGVAFLAPSLGRRPAWLLDN